MELQKYHILWTCLCALTIRRLDHEHVILCKFKPSSFLKQLIIYKMSLVKRTMLGNPSFPKKNCHNKHLRKYSYFTGLSNFREGNGKINQRYRVIFTWRWNENLRTKQKQQMNSYTVIWLVYRTDTNACGFWLLKRSIDTVLWRHTATRLANWTIKRAKKVMSDSPELVDFAIGLGNFAVNLPDKQGMFFEQFK